VCGSAYGCGYVLQKTWPVAPEIKMSTLALGYKLKNFAVVIFDIPDKLAIFENKVDMPLLRPIKGRERRKMIEPSIV
jgi:hypothetical protein